MNTQSVEILAITASTLCPGLSRAGIRSAASRSSAKLFSSSMMIFRPKLFLIAFALSLRAGGSAGDY
jgi:hypothetical protein